MKKKKKLQRRDGGGGGGGALDAVREGDARRGWSLQVEALHVHLETVDGGVALVPGRLLGHAHLAGTSVLLGHGGLLVDPDRGDGRGGGVGARVG